MSVLYLQSSYSMLKSTIELERLVKLAKDNNYQFVALTDEALHGTIDFFKYANKYKIKPILGLKLTVLEPNETQFLIYVKNNVGYENILKLSLLKQQNHHFNINDLLKYQKGLIFVTSGFDSLIDQTIILGNKESVSDYLIKYNNYFDDFYIGLSLNHNIQHQSTYDLYNIVNKLKLKVLPVHQTNYELKTDSKIYESLIKIENESNNYNDSMDFHFLTNKEVTNFYSNFPKLNEYVNEFVSKIDFSLPKNDFKMPKYPITNDLDSKEYLKSLSRLGLKRRLMLNNIKDDKTYIKRLEHELDVICNMNFDNYFLIVYDFIKYAKDQNILVGPGRGSAAGSLVAYCLGITNVDPIKYNLIFERFLNPSRMSMPDIDIDFPDNKRDEVINYVKEKYGENHICSITTFSMLGLRSSIRDVAKVLKLDQTRTTGIVNAAVNNEVDTSDLEVMKVLNSASKIEGLPRQTGTHAAGIILSNLDLTKTIPLQTGSYNFYQSQYDANTMESLGLHKIDFLGIKNLTIINDILELLSSKGINLDINKIPLDDKLTYDLLSKGETTGLFQLESDGMRKVLSKLKPSNFEDIVATLALYRPGPMANIDIYIERRHGKTFNYLHKDLESILKPTFGIIIYQEQIMQIAQKFAGYNLFEADMLRVGMSKKDLNILKKERINFVKGAAKLNYNDKLANQIYDYIVKFSDYGFNRSHSVSYGLVSYQMAYLKSNYYLEFMAVLLESVLGNDSQTLIYLNEIKSNGYTVVAPHLLISDNTYKIIDNVIVMPLNAIKGINNKTVLELLEVDKEEFTDLLNVKKKLSNILAQQQFNNLIHAGALDYLKLNRKTLIENSDLKTSIYDIHINDYKLNLIDDYSFSDNAIFEKSALGLNLKFSLSTVIQQKISNLKGVSIISKLDPKANIIIVAGVITSQKEITNKSGNKMIFLDITDGITNLNVTVFSNEVLRLSKYFDDKINVFKLEKNIYNEKVNYILKDITKN